MAFLRDLKSNARTSAAPVTVGIVVAAATCFLIAWFARFAGIENFVFQPRFLGERPWTLLTYPFVETTFIGILFSCWWLWGIGGMVERELRSQTYALFFALMTVLPALFLLIGDAIFGVPHPLASLYLPVAGVTIAWATRSPESTILMMMVIPIKAKWLGLITVGLVLFGYGSGSPAMGVLACVHLALAWAYASQRLGPVRYGSAPIRQSKSQAWTPRERDDKYLSEVKERERERAERERLRKLFEGSLKDDPEDRR